MNWNLNTQYFPLTELLIYRLHSFDLQIQFIQATIYAHNSYIPFLVMNTTYLRVQPVCL